MPPTTGPTRSANPFGEPRVDAPRLTPYQVDHHLDRTRRRGDTISAVRGRRLRSCERHGVSLEARADKRHQPRRSRPLRRGPFSAGRRPARRRLPYHHEHCTGMPDGYCQVTADAAPHAQRLRRHRAESASRGTQAGDSYHDRPRLPADVLAGRNRLGAVTCAGAVTP